MPFVEAKSWLIDARIESPMPNHENRTPLLLILAVAQDPTIFSSRASILRSAGYIVRETLSPIKSISLLENSDFDPVLLCHCHPVEELNRITRAIRCTGSQIPVFTVARSSGHLDDQLPDGLLPNNPAELIEGLSALTSRTRQ